MTNPKTKLALPPPMRANMPAACVDARTEPIPAIVTDHPRQWLVQAKLDGWRCLTLWSGSFGLGFRKREGAGLDGCGERLAVGNELRKSVWELLMEPTAGFQSALLDGEWLGVNAANQRRDAPERLVFFDLLWLNGRDLRGRPAEERFSLLSERLPHEWLVPRPATDENPDDFARRMRRDRSGDVEGLVFKRRDSPYLVRDQGECPKNTDWIKYKWR
jgi:ATP-dependent DNA ligase